MSTSHGYHVQVSILELHPRCGMLVPRLAVRVGPVHAHWLLGDSGRAIVGHGQEIIMKHMYMYEPKVKSFSGHEACIYSDGLRIAGDQSGKSPLPPLFVLAVLRCVAVA